MIYFDNSSTTKPCRKAIECMRENMLKYWGNPSSLHMAGVEAQYSLDNTRKALAQKLGAKSKEIIFTSGGTQSNNIAIFGAVNANKRRGNTVITTQAEHPSVANCFNELENQGFNVIRLKLDNFGNISLEELESVLNDDVILVSIMSVNNELGTVMPVADAAKLVKSKCSAVFHTDAVQAFGKEPLNVKRLGVDLLSVSGHKVHAAKGVGALYIKSGTKLNSPVFGGGQENNLRSGTEPMPAIASLFGALQEMNENQFSKNAAKVKTYLTAELQKLGNVIINSAPNSSPFILNVSIPPYPSEVLLNYLSEKEIYVSSGSACAKGQKSHVLTAAGLDSKIIDSSLRLSFCKDNTIEEAKIFIEALNEALNTLRI